MVSLHIQRPKASNRAIPMSPTKIMQVKVMFDPKHQAALAPFARTVWVRDGEHAGCVQMTCDLAVAALVLDAPEIFATLGAIQRFFCRKDTPEIRSLCGCSLCKTSPFEYHLSLQDLDPTKSALRTTEDSAKFRAGAPQKKSKKDRLAAGKTSLLATQPVGAP